MSLLDHATPGVLAITDARELLARIPDDSIDLVVLDPPFWFGYDGDDGTKELQELVAAVVLEAERVLRPTGHLAYTVPPAGSITAESFNARLALPQVFGVDPYEVRRPIPRRHDLRHPQSRSEVTLWVPATHEAKLNRVERPMSPGELAVYHEDERGRYQLRSLVAPHDRPSQRYEILGTLPPAGRSWRYSRDRMDQLLAEGLIVQKASGTLPRLKAYVSDDPTVALDFNWDDLPPVPPASERSPALKGFSIGQKPLAFAQRLIELGTSVGNIVLDPFCGLGTTLVAAEQSGRRWIGGDLDPKLVAAAASRFEGNPDVLTVDDLSAYESFGTSAETPSLISNVASVAALRDEVDELKAQVERYTSTFAGVREILGISGSEDEILSVLDRIAQGMADQVATPERLAEHAEDVRGWVEDWDRLGDMSQRFLPQAAMLLEVCERIGDADYGAAVLQYCKALESEILEKLFDAYKRHFDSEIEATKGLADQEPEESKAFRFAKAIQKDDPKFTLGTMQFVMGLIKRPDGTTLGQSLLLQHLRDFVTRYFDHSIREKVFVDEVGRITRDFRNKAAHPGQINRDDALACRDAVRSCLNNFVRSYRPAHV